MRKRILSMFLCLVLLLSAVLAGCGKKSNDKEQNKQEVNQEVSQDDQNDKQEDQTEEKEPTISLIANGKSDYVIVRSAKATSVEIHACEELQSYLKKMSGTKVKIVTDKEAVSEKEIVVGKTNRETDGAFNREELTEDGFVIKTTGDKVWLVGGGDRGTLYSVYSFLETYLGCRYYTKEVEKVPETKTVAIADIKEDKQIPQIYWRDVDYESFLDEDLCAKLKINSTFWGKPVTERIGGAIRFCKDAGGHSHAALVSPDLYFKDHPEYFSMNAEGKRVPNNQLCLTNPDVLKITIQNVKKWLREDPDCEFIDVSQNDGGMACLCEECKKVYAEEGDAYQGTNIRFTNAVAEAIKDEFPNVYVTTFAYEYTRKPNTKTKPADNVVIRLCTMGTCFGHEKSGATCDSTGSVGNDTNPDSYYNTYFWEDLEAWAKITDGRLMVYDYAANFWFLCATWPDFDLLYKNFNWYAKNVSMGIQVEANSRYVSVEFGELRGYLIAKLLWNPEMTEEEYYAHMNDFLTGVYGPGGKYIGDFIELSQLVTEDQHFGLSPGIFEMFPTTSVTAHDYDELPDSLTVEMVKNYSKTDWKQYWNWYSDEKENPLTAQGKILFGKALAMAETKQQKEQIEKIYLQVDYLKSYYYYTKFINADGELRTLITNFIKANPDAFTEQEAKTLPEAVYQAGTKQIYEMYAAYNKTLCESLVNAGVTSCGLVSLEGWQGFDFEQPPSMW